jgi:hypothetical protein
MQAGVFCFLGTFPVACCLTNRRFKCLGIFWVGKVVADRFEQYTARGPTFESYEWGGAFACDSSEVCLLATVALVVNRWYLNRPRPRNLVCRMLVNQLWRQFASAEPYSPLRRRGLSQANAFILKPSQPILPSSSHIGRCNEQALNLTLLGLRCTCPILSPRAPPTIFESRRSIDTRLRAIAARPRRMMSLRSTQTVSG